MNDKGPHASYHIITITLTIVLLNHLIIIVQVRVLSRVFFYIFITQLNRTKIINVSNKQKQSFYSIPNQLFVENIRMVAYGLALSPLLPK